MITRPMLAAKATSEDLDKISEDRFPLLVSPKLDGIRVLCHPELGPVTRKFKPVPNKAVREYLSNPLYVGQDGEVVLSDYPSRSDFNSIQSAVMSEGGKPDFKYFVFDNIVMHEYKFSERLQVARKFCHDRVVPLWQGYVANAEEARVALHVHVSEGYEGIILRCPFAPYKSGRSTLKELGMVKYKPLADAEGTVVGVVELLHNENPQEKDAFGLAERSSHKEGKVPAGVMGTLVLHTEWGELEVGTGFTASDRERLWRVRDEILGKTVTFTYQAHGMKDKPRFPVFKGFRED